MFFVLSLILVFESKAQVILKTNLLHTVPLNKSMVFEVRIGKGKIDNYTKFQIEVPKGVTIKEVESRSGTFSFEENKVKIIWVVTPSDSLVSIRLKLMPMRNYLSDAFHFKYYYLVNDDKREFESLPFKITFKDTTLPIVMSAPMHELISKHPAPIPLPAVKSGDVASKGTIEVNQQVKQLKSDSKEALAVGEKEKELAVRKLDSLEIIEQKLAELGEGPEKDAASKQFAEQKEKAEEDLVIAERVLTLAKTLESQADEIERINASIEKPANEQEVVVKKQVVQSVAKTHESPVSSESETSLKQTENNSFNSNTSQTSLPVKSSNADNDVVFKIQLGAFNAQPDMTKFKGLGEIVVVRENEIYKALTGNFSSREQALKYKNQITSQVPGCFVVKYQNGVRVK